MRRTGHIRERSPGAFELRYSLKTDPVTGKRKTGMAAIRGARDDAEKELPSDSLAEMLYGLNAGVEAVARGVATAALSSDDKSWPWTGSAGKEP